RDSGYDGPDHIALLPPILLDRISADLLLACDPEVGTDLLTQYSLWCALGSCSPRHWQQPGCPYNEGANPPQEVSI
ncbi:MAG: hypothetical protein ABFD20_06875, partial [Anaerolineales bacterium]